MAKVDKAAFIVTKPLQLMVAMTLRDQLRIQDEAQLLLVKDFSGADEVFERIKQNDRHWSCVRSYESRKEALNACQREAFDTIFIDSDVGVRICHSLYNVRRTRPNVRFAIYEEGCGTYQDDYYSKFKAAILRLLGVGDRLGGSRYVSSIWVYEPEEYNHKFPATRGKVHRVEKGLAEFICEYAALLEEIFCDKYFIGKKNLAKDSNVSCVVYLSSWKVYQDAIEALSRYSLRYIKLHPHIRECDTSFLDSDSILVPSTIPAELLLINLAGLYREIDVYHHDSSVERYITLPNVKFVNLHDV